jgi:hypothetical protein
VKTAGEGKTDVCLCFCIQRGLERNTIEAVDGARIINVEGLYVTKNAR